MSIIKRSLSITSYYAYRDALSDKERAFVSGTDDYVTKPFEIKNYYLEFVPFCVVIKLIHKIRLK